jgi:5'(3')-deoxyribonucleotidase
MAKKPVIAVDVDDVLMPLTPHFVKHLNARHGTSHRAEDNKDFFYDISFGFTREQVEAELKVFGDSDEHAAVRPIDGAIAALQKLQEKYDIHVITARGNHWRRTTEAWLHRMFPATFEHIHFLYDPSDDTVHVPKSAICKQIGATVMIDDAVHNIEDCVSAGIRGILFGDYVYNREAELPTGVVRAKDWKEVVKVLM